MNLQDFRRNYSLGKLSKADLDPNPIKQFERWMQQTVESGFSDPTAMVIASVDSNGMPNQRYVLLKQFDEDGFVFFTDTESQKGREIAQNPQISLLFPWHQFERQVRIRGVAKPLNVVDVEAYFHSRPKMSQKAAACSQQSQPIASREALEKKFRAIDVTEHELPLPARWGGYRVIPQCFEFWQGGDHRLHDRFQYDLDAANIWQVQRLQP